MKFITAEQVDRSYSSLQTENIVIWKCNVSVDFYFSCTPLHYFLVKYSPKSVCFQEESCISFLVECQRLLIRLPIDDVN